MPTKEGLFEELPNELILQIAGLLPITDVLPLKSATYNSIQILEWRIQPSEYLKSTGPFINADDLMDVMAKHGAAVSGSRTLAYFLPGSAVNTSDWDIYVPPIPTSVMAVKNDLDHSGVTFESCLQRAARQLQKGSVFLTANQMISIVHKANHLKRAWLPQEQAVVDAIRRRYPALRNIGQSIFSFYASHVQCILTKHVAFHMYYTLAAQNTAYTWRVPQVLKGKAEAAIQKYKQRGFQFTTAPNGADWNLRS
ncbi:hypothetical protein S40285_09706, partial [Stachybotrys chlorohalonatus IBT 40285]